MGDSAFSRGAGRRRALQSQGLGLESSRSPREMQGQGEAEKPNPNPNPLAGVGRAGPECSGRNWPGWQPRDLEGLRWTG